MEVTFSEISPENRLASNNLNSKVKKLLISDNVHRLRERGRQDALHSKTIPDRKR